MCVPTRFLSHSISQLKAEFCTRNKIKWLALMICCIKASHHKVPATFASIHFCFQPFASSFLRPTFYIRPFCIQLFASSFLRPTFYIQPFCAQPSTSGLLNPAFASGLLHPASYIQSLTSNGFCCKLFYTQYTQPIRNMSQAHTGPRTR